MTKKKAAPKQKAKTNSKPKPKQGSLPGLEDRALAELEALAEQYAEIRDDRMALNEKEVELNDELLALMKKHKKTEYHHGDVHCWIKATDERVRVKIGELTPKQKVKESKDAVKQAEEEVETAGPDDLIDAETEETVSAEIEGTRNGGAN